MYIFNRYCILLQLGIVSYCNFYRRVDFIFYWKGFRQISIVFVFFFGYVFVYFLLYLLIRLTYGFGCYCLGFLYFLGFFYVVCFFCLRCYLYYLRYKYLISVFDIVLGIGGLVDSYCIFKVYKGIEFLYGKQVLYNVINVYVLKCCKLEGVVKLCVIWVFNLEGRFEERIFNLRLRKILL